MNKLANEVLSNSFLQDLKYFCGPFISCNGSDFYFDVTTRRHPFWLGHLASPMFGIAQFEESWGTPTSGEFDRLLSAFRDLRQRAKARLPNNLELLHSKLETSSAKQVIQKYIALSILDQYPDTYFEIVESIKSHFKLLNDGYSHWLADAFIDPENFRFGLRFKDQKAREQFLMALNRVGIATLANHDEKNSITLSLNLAFRHQKLQLFWERLELVDDLVSGRPFDDETVELNIGPNHEANSDFHSAFMHAKVHGKPPRGYEALKYLSSQLESWGQELGVYQVTKENYQVFRDRILEMQQLVYEPTRQTPAAEFDMLFESDEPLAIVACSGDKIAAMVFAGQLRLFREEHGGIDSDPFIDDPSVYYSVDLTVAPQFRGGTGKIMKQALLLLAIESGVTAIHGRNRDRLAAGMWAINLSLGSYELQHLENDYRDNQRYKDCIYYRCPLRWSEAAFSDINFDREAVLGLLGPI